MSILKCFLLCLVAVLSTSIAYSQSPEPCNGDCDDPWSAAVTRPLCYGAGANVCCFAYTYKTRNTCGAQEIALLDITITLDPNSNCSLDRMLYEALNDLIRANPMGFNPTSNGSCAANWRVTVGSCWRQFLETTTNGTTLIHYQPCGNEVCCYQQYRVCRSSSGTVTISKIGLGYTSGDNCPPSCPYYSCRTIMDIDNPIPPGTSKTVIGSSISESVSTSAIIPNPTTGFSTLKVKTARSGEFRMIVVAGNGDVVIENRHNISGAGEHEISVDLEGVANGTYQYILTQGDEVVNSGQIKVMK